VIPAVSADAIYDEVVIPVASTVKLFPTEAIFIV
jgi:hypothetical protein